jgi:hypothetical protein
MVLAPDNSSDPMYTQVFGPSLNPVTLSAPSNQVSIGILTFCTPSFYSFSTVTGSSSLWVPPLLTTDSNGDGLRITNTDGSLIDISSANGTVTIMAGVFGQTDVTPHYTSYLSANISVCSGYVSWAINNVIQPSFKAISTTPLLQTPTDITCIIEPFNLDTWMSDSSTEFVLGLLQGLSWTSDDLARKAMDILLSTIDHTSSIAILDDTSSPPPNGESHPNYDPSPNSNSTSTSSPTSNITNTTNNIPLSQLLPLACSLLSSSTTSKVPQPVTSPSSIPEQQWVLSGLIADYGTGQTLLGTILQAFITLFSILTVILLFTPGLPLITEWSAQWLGLVYGLSPPRVQECVEGTSAGGNYAVTAGEEMRASGGIGEVREDGEVVVPSVKRREPRRDLSVFLGSAGGDGAEGNPYLMLGLEKSRVRRGWGHV